MRYTKYFSEDDITIAIREVLCEFIDGKEFYGFQEEDYEDFKVFIKEEITPEELLKINPLFSCVYEEFDGRRFEILEYGIILETYEDMLKREIEKTDDPRKKAQLKQFGSLATRDANIAVDVAKQLSFAGITTGSTYGVHFLAKMIGRETLAGVIGGSAAKTFTQPIPGALSILGFALLAATTAARVISKKYNDECRKACNKIEAGKGKDLINQCTYDCRIKAYALEVKRLKHSMSMCDQYDEPDKCRKMFNKKIDDVKERMERFRKKSWFDDKE